MAKPLGLQQVDGKKKRLPFLGCNPSAFFPHFPHKHAGMQRECNFQGFFPAQKKNALQGPSARKAILPFLKFKSEFAPPPKKKVTGGPNRKVRIDRLPVPPFFKGELLNSGGWGVCFDSNTLTWPAVFHKKKPPARKKKTRV